MYIEQVEYNVCVEISKCKVLNDRRNLIQNHVLKQSLISSKNKKIIWNLTPRFGKSYLSNLFFVNANNKIKGLHLVIAPQLGILEQWKKDVTVSNVIYVTVKTASTLKFINKYKNVKFISIVYDEADEGISSDKAIVYPKVLQLNSHYKFALSGSFSNDNVKYLGKEGFDYMFKINTDEGVLMGILPEHKIINVPITLSYGEKKLYYEYYKKIEFFLSPFKKLFPDGNYAEYVINCCKWNEVKYKLIIDGVSLTKSGKEWCEYFSNKFQWGNYVLFNKSKNYNLYRAKLNLLIDECESKVYKIKQLIKKHQFEKGIVFVQRTEFSNHLASITDVLPYHSKLSKIKQKENLEFFRNNKNSVLCSISMTNRGFTESSISFCIRAGYNSKDNTYQQQLARCLTFDEKGQNPVIYNLYIDDFIFNDERIISKEKIKLIKSQKNTIVDWE